MQLDRETCRKARLAHDARFDGRFFIGVRTTKVFCRPICPAPSPREQNVEYYPSAAAAAMAGLRPCLRCRPECAPGTPAWNGSSSTVSRALREISEGALDAAGVRDLAERLGIGDRHLRRLFLEHLGAPPIAVAQTNRLLSAKRLLDETDLPVSTVALAAGFGSVRRFNHTIHETWQRTPRELRKTRRAERGPRACNTGPSFRLRYRPPFDWDALLGFLEARAIPGVECVENGRYRRSIVVGGVPGVIELSHGVCEVVLQIDHPRPESLLGIVSRVRRLCDLDADPGAIASALATDDLLRPLVDARPGLRVPGAWDGFELGIRAILGQQVSVRGASTLAGRLVARFGRPLDSGRPGVTHLFPGAEDLASTDLASIGLPQKRADTLCAFSAAVASGALALDNSATPEQIRERLRSIPGIGEWTAEYIAMRALHDPDAFPAADLVLLRAAGVRAARELKAIAERWRPWRAYAALHLWQGVKDGSCLQMDGKPRRKAAVGGG
ncbi:MAG TPA: AlkA N-terminal domain-containing protein [Bryobacteraceae bacterium]|nr:AlkA N-terminal domain-containing protein [Bryobacteraceae bacterium]